MANHSPEHSHPTPKVYLIILLVLVIGTILTWSIAQINLGIFNPVVALSIAVIKAVLVILYFMHVRYSSKLTMVTVAAGFFWLLILITLSLSDYISRDWSLGQ